MLLPLRCGGACACTLQLPAWRTSLHEILRAVRDAEGRIERGTRDTGDGTSLRPFDFVPLNSLHTRVSGVFFRRCKLVDGRRRTRTRSRHLSLYSNRDERCGAGGRCWCRARGVILGEEAHRARQEPRGNLDTRAARLTALGRIAQPQGSRGQTSRRVRTAPR